MTYNLKSPAVKRLMQEALELAVPTELYHAQPLDDNLFEWHFTIRGPENSDFEGGIYHGRISLPSEYPMKPPNITLLTPNGRFEQYRQICLSISGYHPETWRPSWSIRTALLAIIGFMPSSGAGAIGSLDLPSEERRKMAKSSNNYTCDICGPTNVLVLPITEASSSISKEATQVASQFSLMEPLNLKAEVSEANTNTTVSTTTPTSFTNTDSVQSPISVNNGNSPSSTLTSSNSISGIPTPSYWLCYPIYQPPINTTPVNPMAIPNENGPLGFDDWLKMVQSSESSGSVPKQSANANKFPGDVSLKENDKKLAGLSSDAVGGPGLFRQTDSLDVNGYSCSGSSHPPSEAISENIAQIDDKQNKNRLVEIDVCTTINTSTCDKPATVPIIAESRSASPITNETTRKIKPTAPKMANESVVNTHVVTPIPTDDTRNRTSIASTAKKQLNPKEIAQQMLKEAANRHQQRISSINPAPTNTFAINRNRSPLVPLRIAQLLALTISFFLIALICRRLTFMVS